MPATQMCFVETETNDIHIHNFIENKIEKAECPFFYCLISFTNEN